MDRFPLPIGTIASGIAIPLVVYGLAKLFPARLAPEDLDITKADLRGYAVLQLMVVGPYLLLAAITGVWWWNALRLLADTRAAAVSARAVHAVLPDDTWLLALPCVFLGAASAAPLVDLFLRGWLRDGYQRYVSVEKGTFGWDPLRAGLFLVGVMVAMSGAFTGMLLGWYVLFTEDAIVINRFFGAGERTVPYGEVTRIVTAPERVVPNGDVKQDRAYVLHFADGGRWSTVNNFGTGSAEQERVIVQFVAERAGLVIEEIPRFERGML